MNEELEIPVIKSGRDYVLQCGIAVHGESFFLTPELLDNYRKIYNYLFNHAESIKDGIYPNRGLWIGGKVGNGKSLALKVMNKMILLSNLAPIHRFKTIPFLDFEKEYQKNPDDIFELYGKKSGRTIAIDEVLYKDGETRADYKTPINLIEEFVHNRCELFTEEGIVTHFASNFRMSKAIEEEMVGKRAKDRFNEMFNAIDWKGETFRGNLENMEGGIHG